eukprot:924625-Heterocapsa_arctica.AAC.1
MLYEAAKRVDEFLDLPARRIAARSNISYFLRRLNLPPLYVPVLRIPAAVFAGHLGLVRAAMRAAVVEIRCEPA